MAANLLSDASCKAASPRTDGKALILPDGEGLRLVVKPHGTKEWQVRYTIAGKESAMSLGQYPSIGLSAARETARRIKAQVKSGINPVKQRQIDALTTSTANDTTFKRVADEWLQNKKDGIGTASGRPISASYQKKIRGLLNANLFPLLGDIPIQQITPPVLKAALLPISERESLDVLATCRRIAGEIFNLAKSDGRYIGDNPYQCLVFRKHEKGERKALPWSAMNGFLHRLDAGRVKHPTAICINLMVMTACRPGEARNATWQEFDLAAALWTIPASRMKNRKPHIIPLSAQCVEKLRSLKPVTGHREHLFPSQLGSKAKTLSNMGLLGAVRLVAGTDDVDAHGFRATFRTHAEESGLWSFDAMECALSHGKKNAVVAAYARATHLEERKRLAQWYSDQLDIAKHGAQVIPMQA